MPSIEYVHRKTCAMDGGSTEACSPHWEHFIRAPDHESHLGEFDIVYCRKCRIGFTDPYPTEETSPLLYEAKSSADFDVIQDSIIDKMKDYFSRQLIRSFLPESGHGSVKRVLDFGCGNARFALSSRDVFLGSEVDAVDFQDEPPALLKSGKVPRLHYRTVRQFAESDTTYDVIILRHVLEHTHRPVELISKLGNRLQPGGVFYIEVPNLDSGCAKLFGKDWKGHYMPRHIFHYTPAAMTSMLAQAGLEGEVGGIEPPHMGNMVSILTGLKKSNRFVQVLGGFLHPIQLLTEAIARSSSCINVKARKASSAFGDKES